MYNVVLGHNSISSQIVFYYAINVKPFKKALDINYMFKKLFILNTFN